MQVSKWGNSLAIRIPASVVDALRLREGDDIEVRVAKDDAFELTRPASADDILARIRKYRGRLPQDFKFVRQDAHERP